MDGALKVYLFLTILVFLVLAGFFGALQLRLTNVGEFLRRWNYAYLSEDACNASSHPPSTGTIKQSFAPMTGNSQSPSQSPSRGPGLPSAPPLSVFCNPPLYTKDIPPMRNSLQAFDVDVAQYILAAVAAIMAKVQKKEPLKLPGNPPRPICLDTEDCLCVTFLTPMARYVIFRGTGSAEDLIYIDMAKQQSIASFEGYARTLLQRGVPTTGSFPQDPVEYMNIATGLHAGFYSTYQNKIADALNRELSYDKEDLPIIVGGHSMGASISQICAVDVKVRHKSRLVCCYALASTRVGDMGFAKIQDKLTETGTFVVYNVFNTEDPIPNSVATVQPNFAKQLDSDVINYVFTGKLIPFTTHAPSAKLAHGLGTYAFGIQNMMTPIAPARANLHHLTMFA